MANNPSQPQHIFMGNTSVSKVYSYASGSQVKVRPMWPTWTTLRTGMNSSVESNWSALRIIDDNDGEIATILATPWRTGDTPPTWYHGIYQEELYLLWKWMWLRSLYYSRFMGELENLNGGSYTDLYTNTIGYESYWSWLYTLYYPDSFQLGGLYVQKTSFNPNAMNPTLLISDSIYHRFNILVNEIYGFSYRIPLTGSNFSFWFPYCLENQGYVRFNIEAQNQLRTMIFVVWYPFDSHEQRQLPMNQQYGWLYTDMSNDTAKLYWASNNDMLEMRNFQSPMNARWIDTIMNRYSWQIMLVDAQYQMPQAIWVNITDYRQSQAYEVVTCDFSNSSERPIYQRNPYIAIPNDYVQIQSWFIELM